MEPTQPTTRHDDDNTTTTTTTHERAAAAAAAAAALARSLARSLARARARAVAVAMAAVIAVYDARSFDDARAMSHSRVGFVMMRVEQIQRKFRVRERTPQNAPRIRAGAAKKDQKAEFKKTNPQALSPPKPRFFSDPI